MRLKCTNRAVKVSITLVFLLTTPTGATAQFHAGESVARVRHRIVLAVGVSKFLHAREPEQPYKAGWLPLWHAEHDAQDIVTSLSHYGFKPAESTPLLGAQATTARVRSSLVGLVKHLQSNPQNDYEVVLYFSTHGWSAAPSKGGASLVILHDTPAETQLEAGDHQRDLSAPRALDRDWVLSQVVEMMPDHVLRVAVIYDACYVAGGKSRGLKKKGRKVGPTIADYRHADEEIQRIRSLGRATYVLSAVGHGQAALERRADENSLYTKYLLEGLGRSDLTGSVSLFSAHSYATDRVRTLTYGQQVPTYTVPTASEADILFPLSEAPSQTTGVFLPNPRPASLSAQVRRLDLQSKGSSNEWLRRSNSPFIPVPGAGQYAISLQNERGTFFDQIISLGDGEVRTLHVWDELDAPVRGLSASVSAGRFFDLFGATTHTSGRLGLQTYFVSRDRNPEGLEWRVGLDGLMGQNLGALDRADTSKYALVLASGDLTTRFAVGHLAIGVGGGLSGGALWRRIQIAEERDEVTVATAGPTAVIRGTWPIHSSWDLEAGITARALLVGANTVGLFDAQFSVGFVWHSSRWEETP